MENDQLNFTTAVADITFFMIRLESAAFRLQNFTVCMFALHRYIASYCVYYITFFICLQLQYHKEFCVEFTADQYHDIFNSRFHDQKTVYDSLVNSLKIWRNKSENCAGWNQYM